MANNYTGHNFDNVLGVYYAKARLYDSQNYRMLSEDPIRNGLNWYAYCENNPILFIDPTGLIREAGYYNHNWEKVSSSRTGKWYDNPDAAEFGENTVVYNSLTQLGAIWNVVDIYYRSDVEELADEVRRTARGFGSWTRINELTKWNNKNGRGLNDTELVLFGGDPVEAFLAKGVLKDVNNALDFYYGKDPFDGSVGNAFKHAYWNALLVEKVGEKNAKYFTDAHEFGSEDNLITTDYMCMDLKNNATGRNQSITLETSFMDRIHYDPSSTDQWRKMQLASTLYEMANNGKLISIN